MNLPLISAQKHKGYFDCKTIDKNLFSLLQTEYNGSQKSTGTNLKIKYVKNHKELCFKHYLFLKSNHLTIKKYFLYEAKTPPSAFF